MNNQDLELKEIEEILEPMIAIGHVTKDELGRYNLTEEGRRYYEQHIAPFLPSELDTMSRTSQYES